MQFKTFSEKKENVKSEWKLFDANDQILGRLATRVATTLRGKDKPNFTPHVDTGDFVVVINAEKIKVTGNKLDEKTYYHHTGYRGGMKSEVLKDRLARRPELIIEDAVQGMLPKGSLGRKLIKKLKIYAGENHPHVAQQPKTVELKS